MVKTDIQIALPSGCYGRVGEYTSCEKAAESLQNRFDAIFPFRFCLKLSELVYTEKGCHVAV